MIDRVFRKKFLIVLILALGFFLRTVAINDSPPSLYGDELTIGLDANSLLKTGQDQLGNSFPLTFQMGAGRPAGYVYGSIPFVAIFGPLEYGVRGLSILSGMGIILLLYLIGKKLFSDKIGLASAFIATVSYWDISLSRVGFEAHFALFLTLLGTYFLMKASEKPALYILSALSFGIALHTYPTYKVTLILFLPLLLWYLKGQNFLKAKKYFLIGVSVFLMLGFIALSQTFIGGSETRFSDINIFSKEEVKAQIEQKINLERNISKLPDSLKTYFHNKPIEYFKIFSENYLQNFSLDFLIIHGDRNPRHNMATMGELFFAEGLLVLLGVLTIWQKNKKLFVFLVCWLLIGPVPTAIVDLPHALRSSLMLPALIIFAGFGLIAFFSLENRIVLLLIGLIFIIQYTFFIQKLFFLAPSEYSHFWSYSAKIASYQAIENKDKIKYVLLSDRIDSIEYAYPVYAKIDPTVIISQNKVNTKIGEYKFKKFGNVYIGNIPSSKVQTFIDSLDGSVLFLDTPQDLSSFQNYQIIDENKKPILVKVVK